jgi:hypothetical protein
MGTHCTFDVSEYELLSRLARDDPSAFEALRSEMISDFIEHKPERYRRRLRGLQFRVDAIRRLTHNPLAALIKIQALMWDSFLKMDQELQKFVQCIHGNSVAGEDTTDSLPSGRVIELQSYLLNRRGFGS